MTDRHALIKACHDNRDDDTTRLVYADWLEDRNETARAELIRVQVELSRIEEPRHKTIGFKLVEIRNGRQAPYPLHPDQFRSRGPGYWTIESHHPAEDDLEVGDRVDVRLRSGKVWYGLLVTQKRGPEPSRFGRYTVKLDDISNPWPGEKLASRDEWLLQTIDHLHRLDQVRGEVVAPDDVKFMDRGLVDQVWIEWKHWLTVADETWDKELPRLVRIIGDVPEVVTVDHWFQRQYVCSLTDRPEKEVFFTQEQLNGAAMVPGMDGLRDFAKDVMVQLLDTTWPGIKFEVAGQIAEPFVNVERRRGR